MIKEEDEKSDEEESSDERLLNDHKNPTEDDLSEGEMIKM